MFAYSMESDCRWNNEIVRLVGELHEYKGRNDMILYHKPASSEHLKKITMDQCISSIEKEHCDPEGYKEGFLIVTEQYEQISFTSRFITYLYELLYSDESGMESETWNKTEVLCRNYEKDCKEGIVDGLLMIPVFLLEFLCIHSYDRKAVWVSILLMNYLLHRNGYRIGRYLSFEKIMSSNEGLLWETRQNNRERFITMFLKTVISAYRAFEDVIDETGKMKPSYDIVRKITGEKNGEFTKIEIMNSCPVLGSSSIEASLKQLVEEGFLVRKGKGKRTVYSCK